MQTFSRLLQLWRLYLRLDLQLLTRNLRLFLIWYVSDTLVNLAALAGMLLLAERFDGIGPWSRAQLLFMLGFATVVGGLLDSLFGYNVLFISRRIGRGQLDHTLIQPQPLWLSFLTEGFMPLSGSGTLLIGVALLVWGIAQTGITLSALWLALLVLNIFASALVVLSFSFIFGTLAFWAPRAAEEISTPLIRMFYHLKAFPLDGLHVALLGSLLSVVPVGFVAWYPSRYLLGLEPSPWAGLLTPLVALLLFLLAVWAMKQGMRHYARTGSQRYHALGHRS